MRIWFSIFILVFFPINIALSSENTCIKPPELLVSDINLLINRSSRIVIATDARWSAPPLSRENVNLPLREGREEVASSGSQDRSEAVLPLYTLTVVEDLKGSGSDTIMVVGAPPFDEAHLAKVKSGAASRKPGNGYDQMINEDFEGHQAKIFWNDNTSGRTPPDTNCAVLPRFSNSGTYLVFVGTPHAKGYEAIKVKNDKWLAYVRGSLRGQQ